MYPGPDDPDLGVFVANLERELRRARSRDRAGGRRPRAGGGKPRTFALFRDAATRRATSSSRRRLRPLPRPRRPRRRARDARAARRHRARPGRREHRLDARRAPATRYVVRRAATVIAVSELAARPARGGPARSARQDRRGRLRCRPRALRATRRRERHVGRSAGRRRRDGVPLPRRALGAQERSAARAGVRAPRRGHADLRRRRPSPRGARGSSGIRARRTRRTRRGPHVDRRLRRALPAEPRRAVRPRDARGDGVGAARSSRRRSVARRSSSHPESGVLVDPLDEDDLVVALSSGSSPSATRTSPAATPPPITTSSCRRRGWRRSSLQAVRGRQA